MVDEAREHLRGHVPAGRTNADEKIWFRFIAIVGLVLVGASGLVMDFPIFGQSWGLWPSRTGVNFDRAWMHDELST